MDSVSTTYHKIINLADLLSSTGEIHCSNKNVLVAINDFLQGFSQLATNWPEAPPEFMSLYIEVTEAGETVSKALKNKSLTLVKHNGDM